MLSPSTNMKRCYLTDTQVLNEELIVAVSVTVSRGRDCTLVWKGRIPMERDLATNTVGI